MAVYKGKLHLQEQLDSFATQTHDNWTLTISLDGPDDGSLDLLHSHPMADRFAYQTGPAKGATLNFLSLMRRATPGQIWAFSDQDDVWLPEKLSRAYQALSQQNPDLPAMYHSRTLITDHRLNNKRLSVARPRPASFCNALVQNIAGGNTIVLNAAATRLIHAAAQEADDGMIAHDWWLYQMLTGVGGVVIHDDQPGLLYRQHADNVVGANDGWRARARRIRMVLDGTYRRWMDANIDTLSASNHRFSVQNQQHLAQLAAARTAWLGKRWRELKRIGIYRQTGFANAVMWGAVVIGRF